MIFNKTRSQNKSTNWKVFGSCKNLKINKDSENNIEEEKEEKEEK